MGSFERNAEKMARKQGIPVEDARKEESAGARKASNAAKRANPNLLKVSGVKAPPGQKKPHMPRKGGGR